MSHKIKINGDNGEFKVVLHDDDSDLAYSPLKAGKEGLYEHDEKLSDKYVLASSVSNIVQQARFGLATLQHCAATYLTDEDKVDAYIKSESDARYINKGDRSNIISESRNGLSLDSHNHDAHYTKISTFNAYASQLNANTNSLSQHITNYNAHAHDDLYLGITAKAVDSAKLEGKTKAEVVSEARDSLVKYDHSDNSFFPRFVPAKSEWMRAPSNGGGFLPYSNANSLIGTSSWNFKEGYFNTLYEGNTPLKDKYQTKSDKLQSFVGSTWSFTTNDFKIHSKRALVSHTHNGLSNLHVNYGDDYENVYTTGKWSFNQPIKIKGGSLDYKTMGFGKAFQFTTDYGSLTIGPQNTGHCHYLTNRAYHWFNTDVQVNGEIYAGSGYNKRVFHQGFLPTPEQIGSAKKEDFDALMLKFDLLKQQVEALLS